MNKEIDNVTTMLITSKVYLQATSNIHELFVGFPHDIIVSPNLALLQSHSK